MNLAKRKYQVREAQEIQETQEDIKFIDLKSQYLAYKEEIDDAVLKVLDSTKFILGPQLKLLEEELSNFCKDKSADGDKAFSPFTTHTTIGCSNGTDALVLALLDVGVKPGDEVITPSFTFVSTVETICLLGAVPVFADINFADALIDTNGIEEKITSKTKAIMPVSLFGQVADMDAINKIAEKHNIAVIEDAAQSFGATYKSKASCSLSKYACTSFYPSKSLSGYGDGGAIFTTDPEAALRIRSLLNHGQSERYEYEKVGINARLDDIQAAVLRVKLRHYPAEIARRQEIAKRYDEALYDHPALAPVKLHQDNTSVYSLYSVYAASGKRDEIIKNLKENGVPTGVYYPKPLHLHKVYREYIVAARGEDYYNNIELPETVKASQRIFSLPMHPFLADAQQDKIISMLKSLY